MKRLLVLLIFAAVAATGASAQEANDHIQVGVFADYLRLSQTSTNFGGVGGRLGFTAFRSIKFEAEAAYDFDQVFTEGFNDTSTGTVTIQRSHLRALHGMVGPKVEIGHFPIHPFITLKGGAMAFRFDNRPATFSTFTSSVEGLRDDNITGVFYPGGGLEGHVGPIGLRLDVGDEMYFNHGTHNNLRVAFGPYIRF